MPSAPQILISGYTEEGSGTGPGIHRYALADDGTIGALLAQSAGVSNPSFLTSGEQSLFAVEEGPNGSVADLDPQSLEVRGRASSGGADPCHLIVQDGYVLAANYSSGTTAVIPVSEWGSAVPAPAQLLSNPGTGPVSDRQGSSRAHQVTATPWGTVLVADLGADRVDEYALTAGSYQRVGSAVLPSGTGPRHVALKGDFLLVAGELDGFLHVLRRSGVEKGHVWQWRSKSPLAATAGAIEAAEQFYPSHIQLSDDGSKLYAAVRGPNTMVVLDVAALADDVAPGFVAEVPSGGNWPRHFAVGQGKIYVANQLSNNVAIFELDAEGLPVLEPLQVLDFGSPACVVLV
ncbi:beta-propeller fold lactonase family protein [Arthrobacter sp. GMC3]|uniref:lactonase family protein n=1 Tax=Arthrobacter sp. GMC3 TaxID=2058894 RepID=UPI000CE3A8BA|nr:beta-propeller fold lactonase family protein [Arthrobacter sp. GMC3]